MKFFEAHRLLGAVRAAHNISGLIFEGKDPNYRSAQVDNFRESIATVREICLDLDLPMSSLHAIQLLETISTPGAAGMLGSGQAQRIVTMLSVTIENETSLRTFFAVSPERAKYYVAEGQHLFGDKVEKAFRSTVFDSAEAGRCFALGRYTASVFHLMRVLELGLGVMADRFSISYDHTNWHNVIEGIEKAVRNMGDNLEKKVDWKDEQEFFSQACSYFMVIKNAWRNYTAHARGKYTDDEAETLIINVRGFMQKLATRLHEKVTDET